jgi:hypothetical protein
MLVPALLLTGCASTQDAVPVPTGTFWGYTVDTQLNEPTLVLTADHGVCESAIDAHIKRAPGTPPWRRGQTSGSCRPSTSRLVATGVRTIARDARGSSASSRATSGPRRVRASPCGSSSGRVIRLAMYRRAARKRPPWTVWMTHGVRELSPSA